MLSSKLSTVKGIYLVPDSRYQYWAERRLMAWGDEKSVKFQECLKQIQTRSPRGIPIPELFRFPFEGLLYFIKVCDIPRYFRQRISSDKSGLLIRSGAGPCKKIDKRIVKFFGEKEWGGCDLCL